MGMALAKKLFIKLFLKCPNTICPECGNDSLHVMWSNRELRGTCYLNCMSCSWEKVITHRKWLVKRHIYMQREKGRKEREERNN